jgi:hypothetical protein
MLGQLAVAQVYMQSPSGAMNLLGYQRQGS